VRSVDDALSITLNTNGRVLRNLIHGADTVMSHILHFYHLAAADFVNVSPAAGILGSPWDDGQGSGAFGTCADVQFLSLTARNTLNNGITKELVESYVMALNKRKEAHAMSAIFAGRHPIQNAIVPGGVSTIFTDADKTQFRDYLNGIRNFINQYYIPDVVFVATASSVGSPAEDWRKYWGVGTAPGTLLSYGEYPLGTNGNVPFKNVNNADMLLTRGVVTYNGTNSPASAAFNTSKIKEYVDYSFYSSPSGLHPSAGVTTPDVTQVNNTNSTKYSWLKAPRYGGIAAEVGPLARMVNTYVNGTRTVTENGSWPLSNVNPGLALGTSYNAKQLVDAALSVSSSVAGLGTALGVKDLFSPLGRHACRALECKFVADAMYSWVDELTTQTAGSTGTYDAYTTAVATGLGYTYVAIPKATVAGEGLAEAPRGALGHWITIGSKKITNYQCVVPSTWNCCPKGNGSVRGPAESALIGLQASVSGDPNSAIVNIARMLHPYDFCIACAVHVVTPDGKDVAKFEMGLDGKIEKL